MDRTARRSWRTISVCVFALVTVSACQKEVTEHATTTILPTVTSQALILTPSYEHEQTFTGTIRAGNTTGVGFELAGKLNELQADSGIKVKQGQILAILDTRLLEAERQEIQASLAQTQADVDLATSTLKRNQELKKSGYVSEQLLDENRSQLNSLAAAKNRLLASQHANQLKLDKSILVAPFDGTISQKLHNLGEVVTAGSPVFTLVGNINPEAYIGVPVALAEQFHAGQQVQVSVQDQTFTAEIAGISAEVNPVSRTLQLRISLPQDARVINGEIAYLHQQQQIEQAGYWVPISALTDGIRGLWNLYVIANDEQQSIIERRDVEILYTTQDMAYIQGAIEPNEIYVSQGLHKLVVGQSVSTIAAATR
ncbi:efflux transporter, RND family, MFP subunit [Shewanella baltica OS625]|uniref:Efflux transporter, RND family, MFP subunit n=1 Tax=Shewanella baltica (strain OS195) TaxID=399599 RepID=A9KWV6_SHEB9|nr:efflux RND transporter periplasmic adaptor subunit [Shewanella baltica]ABX50293.1 efflux transporter, RND family, MFP subunit [Shewanella baltica OS195]ADT95279.1 efflux transporter, RND family, MFP subunit [Shewanella baltica OS678]EHC06414.1 efflux transporter, RND family, MFP subunit [Shewanella baltica OS625]